MSLFSSAEAKKSLKKKYISNPGIKSDLEITEIEVGQSQGGNQYIDFTYDSPEGSYRHRVWAPNMDPELKDGENKEDIVKRNVNSALQHLVHVLETYLPSDKAAVTASSFEDFCNQTKSRLMPVIKGVKLRGKLLLDSNKQYVQFPRFTPYIEKMDNDESILFISDWEMKNRMKRPEAPAEGGALGGNGNDKSNDDLPF
jgi:hypothetical protein